ncbi:protein transport protein S31 [Friedmanniomyces endolithicus]|uniref:Protein transport protein SEC31 n=1 Tax=Friedmanniomyces endolithicus TaxID=329885 RepID=A0AAN6KZS3_9PEZI|nr:protein transport protein S31 [Friedmanniomyces endolithicus]KAK0296158.1 protein transport protein S31 [Friedmanniomyces endolithicus]KAK0923628.1 protein transport protein S31 [Friedmanniomyces endolithicus]KAK0991163.1 protein transport protein S31 [Friedmanniomyces endolithicus]KAK1013200.1 protein transport protein S31 [Friedmanniomyces endolithicus]
MVGLRELQRTAVFAWSPGAGPPLIVTGTRTGAVSDDFSDETKLELWDLGLDKPSPQADLKPVASLSTDSGFNDIGWSEPSDEHPLGLVAGALDNGSVDIWDAAKLREGDSDAHITRTSKHSGAVKALQWNPFRHSMLASVGAKGEIYLYDMSNVNNPSSFRLGASAARADDIECLDWNKQDKTQHILATGSSGGFVTVWDVKQKRDILTLNNSGRKAVSAVAWDPEESTKLATATPNDQDPTIYIWSLRNSKEPERTLQGHELGVLALAWCAQDTELLLSCGKDNQTICWNSRTGEKYGSFAAGSNWAFQTKWNPHNPGLIASASFDGKILVTSTQATNSKASDEQAAATNQTLDGEDFFAKAQTQPQGISFSIPKAPKWLARPCSVAFGFGGKIVRVGMDQSHKSKVSIESFAVDDSIGEAAEKFEQKMKSGDLASICESKIQEAKTEEEKADWRVIETLNAGRSRKKLREYMGFADEVDDMTSKTEKIGVNGDADKSATNGEKEDDDFFGNADDDDSFLANLASTKGAKTNNPFRIYTASDSSADKSITRALMLGNFDDALTICLGEDRMSDAFMIAVCGGQKCIDRAQTAYLKSKGKGEAGPNYLRLLASIVGKNLWDVVHNAELRDWREVMATLCTYADETEFADLCEALGDRLEDSLAQEGGGEENEELGVKRRDASFCYLAGSKLEKVVINWVQELKEQEKAALSQSSAEGADEGEHGSNDFGVHAKCLQGFVEKVSVFRTVTKFRDAELQATEHWKLAPLYRLYAEYAEILASHGLLTSAEQYLALLPAKFEGAEEAQKRVRMATKKAGGQRQNAAAAAAPRAPSVVQPGRATAAFQPAQPPLIDLARNAAPSAYSPAGAMPSAPVAPSNPYAPPANNYAPAGYQPQQQPAPFGQPQAYGGYQPPQQQASMPPPPRAGTVSPGLHPNAQAKKAGDWNDMPANFFKERQPGSRRGTPAPPIVASPFPNAQQPALSPPPTAGPPQYSQPRQQQQAPLPPPPKSGEMQRITSPSLSGQPPPLMQRPSSSAASAYAPSHPPSQQSGSTLPAPSQPPLARGASPYQPPPSTSNAAPSKRYAPAPGSVPSHVPGQQRQVAPNPYAAQQGGAGGYGLESQGRAGAYAPMQGGGGGYGPVAPQPQAGAYGQPPPQQQPSGPYGQPPPQQAGAYAPLQSQPGTPYGQPPPQQQPSQPPQSAAPPPRGPPRGPQTPSNAPPARSGPAPAVQPLPQQASDAPSTENQAPRAAAAPAKPKYPRGDRSHIPASARPIVDILTPEVNRIKSVTPPEYKRQVDDMEKRINILFDHINNEDLLSEETVARLAEMSEAVGRKDWERAEEVFKEIQGGLGPEEGGVWVVGVKRLIAIGKSTRK